MDGEETSRLDRRIRRAMRILENEQTPLPETAEVARRVGMSLFHFVRLFKAEIGESPQTYGRGIILRHAASRLRYSNDPVDVVARDFGYAEQAAFTKAFTRQHGVPPARWQRQAKTEIQVISAKGVRLKRLPSELCLARRYLGPRHLTGEQWADFFGRLPKELHDRPRIGFAYDDPRITPPARIRHDCAVVVEDSSILSDALQENGFELLKSPAGLWAVADVPASNIAEGYRMILGGWFQQSRDYAIEGDPFLERWTRTRDETRASVCVRVRPIENDGDWNMAVLPKGAPKSSPRKPALSSNAAKTSV